MLTQLAINLTDKYVVNRYKVGDRYRSRLDQLSDTEDNSINRQPINLTQFRCPKFCPTEVIGANKTADKWEQLAEQDFE